MTIESNNIYYFSYINKIGGIETFFYYLAKKYKEYDLTIVYSSGDATQIERLQKYVRCIQYKPGMTFKCKKAFFNFNVNIINYVEADEYILVLHGDYKAMVEQNQLQKSKLPMHKKITKYVGISKLVCDSWKELTGIDAELCYNPVQMDSPKRALNLISATRLTQEKGKGRMIQLMNALDSAGIPYIWTIFTDDKYEIDNPNVVYMKPRLDIVNFINTADYLVQLSDNEGYCYSIIEALSCGTPVICTPCPVFNEIGLKDKENCFILDFDMNNIPIDEIYNADLNFTYQPKEDSWSNLLQKGATKYRPNKVVKVVTTRKYYDTQFGRNMIAGETLNVTQLRAEKLIANGCAEIIK